VSLEPGPPGPAGPRGRGGGRPEAMETGIAKETLRVDAMGSLSCIYIPHRQGYYSLAQLTETEEAA